MTEWIQFIADILLFIGDVAGLAINVVWSLAELVISFLAFITSLIDSVSSYPNIVAFMAFGLSMFALYVVKAIFGR